MIRSLRKIIEGPDYFTPESKALSEMVPSGKGVKIKALTRMIPARKVKQELKNFVSMFIPIIPPWMLEFEQDKKHYLVPRNQMNMLVSDEDVDDWNYLLERFNNLLDNLTKLLNNVRKIDYNKIAHDKLLEREIRNRKIKLTEKLLEKTEEKKQKASKNTPEVQIENMNMLMMAAANAAVQPSINRNAPPAKADFVEIANNLKSKYGLEDFQAAAIVGTWMQEGLGKGRPDDIEDAYAAQYGDFGPPPIGSSLVGYGWAQWTNMQPGGRLDRVAAGIGVTDRAWTNQDNLRAFDWELQNLFPSLIQHLKDTQDIDEAVQLFVHIYEAGGNIQNFVNLHGASFLPRRIQSAESVLSGMTKSNAAGAILIPQLVDSYIWYNTNDRTDNLAKFIVDRPTIIDTAEIEEPLIVIPTERPIGQQVLNILFKEPFRKIEKIFEKKKQQQEAKAQTPIQNNTTSITRSPIPESSRPTSNYLQRQQQSSSLYNNDMGVESITRDTPADSIQNSLMKINTKISDLTRRSQTTTRRSLSSIDTVSQKTDNVFGAKVILMTQDIYATEE